FALRRVRKLTTRAMRRPDPAQNLAIRFAAPSSEPATPEATASEIPGDARRPPRSGWGLRSAGWFGACRLPPGTPVLPVAPTLRLSRFPRRQGNRGGGIDVQVHRVPGVLAWGSPCRLHRRSQPRPLPAGSCVRDLADSVDSGLANLPARL